MAEIYDQHAMALMRFATNMLGGDWQRAEDIVQEAVVRAWIHAKERPEAKIHLRAWLKMVVRNLVIDDYRARMVRPQTTDDSDWPEVEVFDPLDQVLTRIVMAEALQDLSRHHQEILQKVYFFDQSTAQVSKTLGIPTGTVKSRCFHAIRALRSAMALRGVAIPQSQRLTS
ncbi:sigma-70 family RNA polymerase sigma factor [Streptomyces sp. 2A115]|uniref:sigma-70 family RNA polymerase sigma factor n=1 Tax=Streptomyces sp. 2A115 TaxID=3457439 RepID=UPI003FD487EC